MVEMEYVQRQIADRRRHGPDTIHLSCDVSFRRPGKNNLPYKVKKKGYRTADNTKSHTTKGSNNENNAVRPKVSCQFA